MSEADPANPAAPAAMRRKPNWHQMNTLMNVDFVLQELQTEARIMENAHDAEDVVTECGDKMEKQNMALWHQGDIALNKKEVLMARAHLRHHPLVIDELQLWWETALHSRKCEGHHDEEQTLSYHDYVHLSRRLIKCCLESTPPDELRRLAEETAKTDMRGAEMMGRSCFMDAIFEFGDLWSSTVDAKDMVQFLHTAFKRIAKAECINRDEKHDHSHYWHQAQTKDGRTFMWKCESVRQCCRALLKHNMHTRLPHISMLHRRDDVDVAVRVIKSQEVTCVGYEFDTAQENTEVNASNEIIHSTDEEERILREKQAKQDARHRAMEEHKAAVHAAEAKRLEEKKAAAHEDHECLAHSATIVQSRMRGKAARAKCKAEQVQEVAPDEHKEQGDEALQDKAKEVTDSVQGPQPPPALAKDQEPRAVAQLRQASPWRQEPRAVTHTSPPPAWHQPMETRTPPYDSRPQLHIEHHSGKPQNATLELLHKAHNGFVGDLERLTRPNSTPALRAQPRPAPRLHQAAAWAQDVMHVRQAIQTSQLQIEQYHGYSSQPTPHRPSTMLQLLQVKSGGFMGDLERLTKPRSAPSLRDRGMCQAVPEAVGRSCGGRYDRRVDLKVTTRVSKAEAAERSALVTPVQMPGKYAFGRRTAPQLVFATNASRNSPQGHPSSMLCNAPFYDPRFSTRGQAAITAAWAASRTTTRGITKGAVSFSQRHRQSPTSVRQGRHQV